MRNMNPQELLAAAQLIAERAPTAELVKNQVGNLAIVDTSGEFIGYIDLRWGEVTFMDESSNET